MELFGMGTGELLLILLLALIIWGPGRLPEIARTIGKTVRTFKKATFDLTSAVTREIEAVEPKQNPSATPGTPKPENTQKSSSNNDPSGK